MSKSTPADLAVAFRSLERRRREAIDAAGGGAPLGELDRHIANAATLLGSAPDAAAVAEAIAGRRSDDWDDADLAALREHATGAGIALRHVVDAAPPDDDD